MHFKNLSHIKVEKSIIFNHLSVISSFGSYNVVSTQVSIKIDGKKLKAVFSLNLSFGIFLYFHWVMSPKRPSQPIPCLIGRQSWCISSDSVVYSDGSRKVGMPRSMYENVIICVLYQQCSKELTINGFRATKFYI